MAPDNRRKFRSSSFSLSTVKSLLYHFMIRYGTYSNDLVAQMLYAPIPTLISQHLEVRDVYLEVAPNNA